MIVENTVTFTLDDKDYIIYESCIVDGSGYTFSIYHDKKHTKYARWYMFNTTDILILGEYFNYVLKRKKDILDYEIIKYSKTELRCNYKQKNITLNDKVLVQYIWCEDKFFKEQSELVNILDRKDKIKKIKENINGKYNCFNRYISKFPKFPNM